MVEFSFAGSCGFLLKGDMKILLTLLTLLTAGTEGRVIVISMDGLRPDAITTLGPELAPNFYRLRTEGAFTDNARTDFDYSKTLPNHTSMITSRPVLGPGGHGLEVNVGGAHTNLHVSGYLAGMFDVAHDHGFRTALIAGKSKFEAFSASYDEERGAPDLVGEDNGRDKIDFYNHYPSDDLSMEGFLEGMQLSGWDLSMLHLQELDLTGHGEDWDLDLESSYMKSVRKMDDYLGRLFELLDGTPAFAGSTNLILVSDHGGTQGTRTHIDATVPTNYTIPFYVWGPGVLPGGDLYELNPGLTDPGTSRPGLTNPKQPIRNGMAGNLALQLMDLPPIPGSLHNVSQQFRVHHAPTFETLHEGMDPGEDANGNGFSNFADYLLGADPSGPHRPDLMPKTEGRFMVIHLRHNAPDVNPQVEISLNGIDWGGLVEGATFLRRSAEETRDGMRLTLEVSTFSDKALLRQVMKPSR